MPSLFLVREINSDSAIAKNDTGLLWENLMIAERRKNNEYKRRFMNLYFWRTTSQHEIDYLEESEGNLNVFEFKWKNTGKIKPPPAFSTAYPNATFRLVSKEDFLPFILS